MNIVKVQQSSPHPGRRRSRCHTRSAGWRTLFRIGSRAPETFTISWHFPCIIHYGSFIIYHLLLMIDRVSCFLFYGYLSSLMGAGLGWRVWGESGQLVTHALQRERREDLRQTGHEPFELVTAGGAENDVPYRFSCTFHPANG